MAVYVAVSTRTDIYAVGCANGKDYGAAPRPGQTTHSPSATIRRMLQVTFAEIVRVLEDMRSSVSAAESHGALCGALCASANFPVERWFEEIIPEGSLGEVDDGRDALNLLFEDTVGVLRGDEMQFEPLLPDDDVALEERAKALSQWCQGFLYGLGTGEPLKPEEIPVSVDEILRDLTHIGQASVDLDDQEGEEEEQAYSEVVEYVRVGVQLIHDELYGTRSKQSAGAD